MTAAAYGKDLKNFALAKPFVSGYLPDGSFEGTLGGHKVRLVSPSDIHKITSPQYYLLAAATLVVVSLALAAFSLPIWSFLALALGGSIVYKGKHLKNELQEVDPLQQIFVRMMKEVEDCTINCVLVDASTEKRYVLPPIELRKNFENRKTCLAFQSAMYSHKEFKQTLAGVQLIISNELKRNRAFHSINMDALYLVKP